MTFSESVSFHACSFFATAGGLGFDAFPGPIVAPRNGGVGCFVRSSNVAYYDCQISGGRGGEVDGSASFSGGHGGDGLEAVVSQLFLSGGSIAGGHAGSGGCDDDVLFAFCGDGGDGGHALRARGAITSASLISPTLSPGSGGAGGWSFCCPESNGDPGLDGLPVLIENGALVSFLPADRRGFQVGSPTRETEVLTLTHGGLPGDQVLVWASLLAGHASFPQHQGVFLLGSPLLVPSGLPIGVADALGELNVAFALGEMGPGLEWITVFFQVTFREAGTGPLLLGPMSAGVLLDSAF